MLWLHQLHQVDPSNRDRFEHYVRDRWLPAVARQPGARLAWFATPTRAAIQADEAVTITAVADGPAYLRFAAEIAAGELTEPAVELAALRSGVRTRLLEPLDYDPFEIEKIDEIPSDPRPGPTKTYMHDFVPPVRGAMTAYVDLMRDRYTALTKQDLSGVVLRASWRTVPGGGPVPEMFNLSEIRDVAALDRLICEEIPREYKSMGTWMWTALAARDRWTTRLLRSAPWSPVK